MKHPVFPRQQAAGSPAEVQPRSAGFRFAFCDDMEFRLSDCSGEVFLRRFSGQTSGFSSGNSHHTEVKQNA